MDITTPVQFNEKDLMYLREMILTRSGIVLESDKDYLLQARLDPVAKEHGFSDMGELSAYLKKTPSDPLHQQVVEAMTTNETSFFRDFGPFEALKEHVLPNIIEHRGTSKTLMMWCGAASSGQEPYTISMVLRDHFPQLLDWNVKFLATDLSKKMLDKCRQGKYSQLEVNRGLPAQLLIKYFEKKGMSWVVKDDLRNMIEFKEMNLTGTWPLLQKMDIVFLRNVLIYFGVSMKKEILEKVRETLQPYGYLFLGGAETTLNIDDHFERVPFNNTSCYRLK